MRHTISEKYADLTANSTLVWNAENRLIKITKPNGDVIDYQYDSQSRRIAKKVTAASTVTTHTAFVYDDWNPIGEYTLTATLTSTLSKSYLWGMDLSGSIQGAGGVGGLLSVHQYGIDPNNQSPITNNFFPTYDGNGNVSEYLNATGTVVAHYEYDAFGNTIVKTGALSDSFAHRFSTKYLDVETGFYYYGFRLYNPNTGRWESRDPIEEQGGLNLYGFVHNNTLQWFDKLGENMRQGILIDKGKLWKCSIEMMISCVCCVWKEFQGVPVEKRESVCGFVDSSGVGWGSKKRDAMREAFANMMQDSEPKCSAEKNCPFKDVPCLPSAPLIPINQLPFKCDEYSYELWQWYDGSRHLFLDKFILPIS